MKNKLLSYFFSGTPGLILLLILFSLTHYDVSAQKMTKKKLPELEVDLGLASIYDNNILRYSDEYLDRFRNNEDEGRFHIDTYDDVILNPSLQITASYRIFGKLKSELDLDFSPRIYLVNPIKNWSYLNIGFRQYLTKRASLKFTYSYIPGFYIRHFKDDDWVEVYGDTPETYQPMGFSKDNYGIWMQNTFFKSTTIRLSFNYSSYFYNKHFIEYDSKDYCYGARLYQTIHERYKLEIGYEFTSSDARGYDEPGETKQNADESDPSYFENGFLARFNWKLPYFLKLNHNLDVGCAFEKRYYTSEHYLELDPLHVGRVDDVYHLSVSYEVSLLKSLQLSAFYRWNMRDSNTSAEANKTYVSEEKDYHQNQFGLELTYNIKW